ncbi:MAG: Fic family protein [Candidatus Caenarcaniphilales bacterium]|nr:Fic family protein [Candidatus Caenarcaniphilales bacterium]
MIKAFNFLLKQQSERKEADLITPELICQFHRMIGEGLGETFKAIPGKLRQAGVMVGGYQAPNHEDVPLLVEELCAWLKKTFHFTKCQSFSEAFQQAIATHVILELIHPFGDGNGRSGRLLEFYILLRGGLPHFAIHIVSNHNNTTRNEYYFHLERACKELRLDKFMAYSIQGMLDGLEEISAKIWRSHNAIFWQNYVYETFKNFPAGKKKVLNRRHELALSLPILRSVHKKDIRDLNRLMMSLYAGVSERSYQNDLDFLCEKELLCEVEKDTYVINYQILFENTLL